MFLAILDDTLNRIIFWMLSTFYHIGFNDLTCVVLTICPIVAHSIQYAFIRHELRILSYCMPSVLLPFLRTSLPFRRPSPLAVTLFLFVTFYYLPFCMLSKCVVLCLETVFLSSLHWISIVHRIWKLRCR